MPTDNQWEKWLERLYNLKRDKKGDHERPHKPVLMLSILDLINNGDNEVPFSKELVDTFRRYFEAVRHHDDQPTIENPFFFLSGDAFWKDYQKDPAGVA